MTLPAGTRLLHPGSLHLSDDASEGPLLIGSRCAGCSLVVFPALAVCPRCAEKGRQMIEARIETAINPPTTPSVTSMGMLMCQAAMSIFTPTNTRIADSP